MSKAPDATPRRRRSSEQTRELMLRAGAELAYAGAEEGSDESVSAVLAHIRLTDVAAKASELDPGVGPVTTGAIYQLWGSQPEYQRDLLFHLIGEAGHPAEMRSVEHGLKRLAEGIEPRRVLAEVIDLDYRLTREAPAVYIDFSAYLVASNPRVREALRESYAELTVRMRTFYELVMRMEGREMRPPCTPDDLAAAVTATVEGFILRRRAEPARVPDADEWPGESPGHSLVVEAALGVYLHFTRPI